MFVELSVTYSLRLETGRHCVLLQNQFRFQVPEGKLEGLLVDMPSMYVGSHGLPYASCCLFFSNASLQCDYIFESFPLQHCSFLMRPYSVTIFLSASQCNTMKDKQITRRRSVGVFAGRFLDCGTFGLCNRMTDSEARPAVTQTIARHADLQPLASLLLLYDDMCHLREYWSKHLDGDRNAQADRVLRLRGFLTRSHQRGHTWWACHTDYAADTCDELSDFRTYVCTWTCAVISLLGCEAAVRLED